jgi:hypothetical protein
MSALGTRKLRDSGMEPMTVRPESSPIQCVDVGAGLAHRFYHVPASNTAVGHLILENSQ